MTSESVQLLFVDVGLILLLARVAGALAVRVHQPPVVGEIVVGILLGPSLFGGTIAELLFPGEIRMVLTGLADIGLALFMFIVGMELRGTSTRDTGKIPVAIATGSMAFPFALGVPLGLLLQDGHDADNRAAFVVFVGLALSVTALPVLARILADRGLADTQVAGIAISAAAMVDVAAWTILAGLQAWLVSASDLWRVALMVPYVLVMLFVVQPLLRRVFAGGGQSATVRGGALTIVLICALLSAAVTEAIGVHFIFGAFAFGLIMPRRDAGCTVELNQRVTHVASVFLPIYFVIAGLKVDLSSLVADQFVQLGFVLVAAVAGKVGGTYLAARLCGLNSRPASAVAVLSNTRGLTELVILDVGMRLGLLDDSLFSLMVLMTLVTTAMCGPLLTLVYRRPVEVVLRPRRGRIKDSRTLVSVE